MRLERKVTSLERTTSRHPACTATCTDKLVDPALAPELRVKNMHLPDLK